MTDLLQVVEFGNQMGGQPIVWDGHTHQYLVPASNRRRILDREHQHGETPHPDGWLYMRRDHGDYIHVQRIRWIDRRWL